MLDDHASLVDGVCMIRSSAAKLTSLPLLPYPCSLERDSRGIAMAITLTAEPRSELGKEKCKKLRAAGRLPANVYGGPFGTSPRALTLDLHSTELAVKRNGKSAQYELAFEGAVHAVRIQQVGYEPVYKR